MREQKQEAKKADYSEFTKQISDYVNRILTMPEYTKEKYTTAELQDYAASLRQIEDGSLYLALKASEYLVEQQQIRIVMGESGRMIICGGLVKGTYGYAQDRSFRLLTAKLLAKEKIKKKEEAGQIYCNGFSATFVVTEELENKYRHSYERYMAACGHGSKKDLFEGINNCEQRLGLTAFILKCEFQKTWKAIQRSLGSNKATAGKWHFLRKQDVSEYNRTHIHIYWISDRHIKCEMIDNEIRCCVIEKILNRHNDFEGESKYNIKVVPTTYEAMNKQHIEYFIDKEKVAAANAIQEILHLMNKGTGIGRMGNKYFRTIKIYAVSIFFKTKAFNTSQNMFEYLSEQSKKKIIEEKEKLKSEKEAMRRQRDQFLDGFTNSNNIVNKSNIHTGRRVWYIGRNTRHWLARKFGRIPNGRIEEETEIQSIKKHLEAREKRYKKIAAGKVCRNVKNLRKKD